MARNPPGEMDRDFDVTKNYADAVKEVGKKENVPVVDCWTDLWEAAGKEQERLAEFLSDGLHLTGKGYEVSVTKNPLPFKAQDLLFGCDEDRLQWSHESGQERLPRDIPGKPGAALPRVSLSPCTSISR